MRYYQLQMNCMLLYICDKINLCFWEDTSFKLR